MSGDDTTPETDKLLRQLAQLDRRARLAAFLNGLGITALILAAVVVLALLADLVWDMPLTARYGLLSAACAAVVIGGSWAFARAWLRRGDPAAIAAMVETTYPQLAERLSSLMEWSDQDSGSGSPLMQQIVLHEARRELERLDVVAPLPFARTTRRGTIGGAVLLALLLPCLFFGGYRLLLSRFATPWRNLERSANLYFVVEPGDAVVSRGADVEISATPQWRFARTEVESATLGWRDESGRKFERQMTWDGDRAAFAATINHVLEPFDFEIRSGRSKSRVYHIDVVDRAALTALTAIVEPPAYSGRAVEEIAGAVGDLEMLHGSSLTLQMRFSLPVDRVVLNWTADPANDGAAGETVEFPGSLSDDRLSAEVNFLPGRSGRFALQLHDAIGLANPHEPQRRVVLIGDGAPQVRFSDRNPASRARPQDVLRLPVEAVDDIGLASLELHYEVVGDDQQIGMIPSGESIVGLRAFQHTFKLDLSTLELHEGSIMSIRGRAVDECSSPGPNEAWTRQRLITISEQADPYGADELSQQQQELAQSLQRLRAAVAVNRQTTEVLRAHARRQAESDSEFDRDADVGALAVADRETVAAAEKLAALFELHPLFETLGDRTRRIGDELLADAEQKTDEAHAAPGSDKPELLAAAHDRLMQAETELAALQRDLEVLADLELDLLELQRLADDAERLARDVAALRESEAKASESAAKDPLDPLAQLRALAADRLRTDHADLTSRLDGLLDRRPELLDAAAEHSLDFLAALREQAQLLAARERGLAAAIEREQDATAAENADSQEPDDAAATRFDELAAQQATLVERAIQMAVEASNAGSESAAEFEEIARETVRAAEVTASGDLAGAAQAAQQAAERAAQAASAGHSLIDPEQGTGDLLQQFAGQQQALAEAFRDASSSKSTRLATQRAAQQQLAENTEQLERYFAEAAEQLTDAPISRGDDGQRAADSSAATRTARELMDATGAAHASDELAAAADSASQAAAQLELAAEQSRSAIESAPDSPVPTEVGRQVAQASRQLRQAGEELGSQPTGSDSSESGESPGAEGSEGTEGQQSGEGEGSSDSQDGEGSAEGDEASGEMSEGEEASELAKAAAALQAAAERLKPREPGDQQAPEDAAPGQQPGGDANTEEASEGAGTAETVRLTDLTARLKERAMRNWGELPGELKSELQQRSQGRPDSDYAPLIRMYFNEISRRQSPSSESTAD